ncbi:MAG: MopE-related protein [Myxococcota bacterium]|nr:MopE-related protein [Myxococcota bacterium]
MFLLLACLVTPEEYHAYLSRAQDADQDGYLSAQYGGDDCDDRDAAVFPGATETCDQRDQDCDDRVDESAAEAPRWFLDADEDRYGAGAPVLACSAPDRHVAVDGDCDDLDASVHPGAVEVCGGGDEDCDGLLDDLDPSLDLGTATSWHTDQDGDGFGSVEQSSLQCSASDGLVQDSSDCDDTDRNINPDATEICGDGVDNDCSGDSPECILRGKRFLSEPDLTIEGLAGAAVASDHDGDGDAEVVLLDPAGLYLFEGPFGDEEILERGDADWSLEASGAVSLAVIADQTGDGNSELLVGNPSDGTVSLFASQSDGFGQLPDWAIQGPITGQKFGNSVSALGGSGALAVLSPGLTGSTQGQLLVWLAVPETDVSSEDADLVFSSTAYPKFNGVRTATGDLDGDGQEDLALSVPALSVVALSFGFQDGILGSRDISDADADILGGAMGQLGAAMATGDLDGDGYVDLLVGEPDGTGVVHIFSGGTAWTAGMDADADAQVSIPGTQSGEQFGRFLHVADLDGNGRDDLVAGSFVDSGSGFLFYGPLGSRSSQDESDAVFVGLDGRDCFSASALLDLNADASDDLVVSCAAGGPVTYAILGQGL